MVVRNKMITERDERRTAEWLRKEAAARGLKAGRKVRIERLATGGLMKLLAQGGIVLCGVERAGYGDMPERANVKEAET